MNAFSHTYSMQSVGEYAKEQKKRKELVRTMVSLTIFSIFDNKTHRRLDLEDFDQFESLLYKMSEVDKKSKDEAR